MSIMRHEDHQGGRTTKRPLAAPSASHGRRHQASRRKKLKAQISLLEQLMRELDPYQPLTAEQMSTLATLGVPATLDPYALTNHLILQLEDALNEWQTLNPQITP